MLTNMDPWRELWTDKTLTISCLTDEWHVCVRFSACAFLSICFSAFGEGERLSLQDIHSKASQLELWATIDAGAIFERS